jgi:hypothetical protein
MAVTTNVVNLDALIKRADLAEPGDIIETAWVILNCAGA